MSTSCGIIPFRKNKDGKMEFFVGHPGGHHSNQETLWMFLKGGVENGESWIDTAIREFSEETGIPSNEINGDSLIPLGSVQQNPHKTAVAFGWDYGDIDPSHCHSNMVNEWTPEIDRYAWMTYDEIKRYTLPSHMFFYDQLMSNEGEET